MLGPDVPHDVRTEILDIVHGLKQAWPDCRTLTYTDANSVPGVRGPIERYIIAVQWLTDRGLSIRDSALTQRGREYSGQQMGATDGNRSDN